MRMDPGEIEGFLENVDEVSRLIDGLKAGTIPPEYVDAKLHRHSEQPPQSTACMATDAGTSAPARDQPCKSAPAGREGDKAARQEDLMRKVQELKENRERKLNARQRYEAYVASQHQQVSTDYTKWDMWCPSDEEDDLFHSLTPNTPQFRAMEKDINERHRRMVERRQIAERERVRGNQAFRERQYRDALRCYELGLEAQRHNMALHANAAMAAIKLQCYVQAMEHCDKVLHLANLLHNAPKHPLCIKAHQRRALAHEALGNLLQAQQDLEAAAALDPTGSEVARQLQRVSLLRAEEVQCKELCRLVSKDVPDSARSDCSSRRAKLKQVEQLTLRVKGATANGTVICGGALDATAAQSVVEAGSTLAGLLEGDGSCRTYFWHCGGLQAAARLLLTACTQGDATTSTPASDAVRALLLVLNAACHSDTNLERLPVLGVLPPAVQLLSARAPVAHAAALLLATASTHQAVRKELASVLCACDAAGLRRLMHMAVQRNTAARGVALSLLSNCLAMKLVQAAARAVLVGDPKWLPLLLAEDEDRSTSHLMRALEALTNMCGDQVLRRLLAGSHMQVVLQVAGLCAPPQQQGGLCEGAQESDLLLAAACGCLCNLCAEPEVQAALAASCTLQQLLDLALGEPSGCDAVGCVSRERAATVVARVARHPDGVVALQRIGAVQRVVGALARSEGQAGQAAGVQEDTWRDACVRALALLTADGTHFGGGCDAGGVATAIRTLLSLLPTAYSALAGNVGLCLSHVAANAAWLPLLHEADCVAVLVGVALHGRGDTASKNAAVALARMARYPPMMERLRQLHGLEIIYQYVRP